MKNPLVPKESRKPYRTTSDLDRIAAGLSERDQQILNLIERLKVASGNQIRRLCFDSARTGRSEPQLARRTLLRMTRAALLRRLDRRIGGARPGSEAFLYCLAPDGQRLLHRQRGESETRGRWSAEPGQRTLDHRLAVADLYVWLTEAARSRDELEIASFAAEPASWRRYLGPLSDRTLKPDAFVQIGLGDLELVWWIEVDRGTVSQRTRAQQAAQYREYWRSGAAGDVMPRVLWIAKTPEVAARATEAIDLTQPPIGLFVVATPDSAIVTLLEVPE